MLEPIEPYIGHAAGLATSVLWTATSHFLTAAVTRIGPTRVNTSRILLAIVLLGITHRLRLGRWVPDANADQVFYLAISGLLGLTIGDQALLNALSDIGPRRTVLLMTTAPLMAALFGRVALHEHLGWIAWAGVLTTVSGVGWVVLERPAGLPAGRPGIRWRGVFLALVGAACQAYGLMLSKKGMGHGWLPAEQHLDPQAATLVRMVFGGLGMAPIVVIHAWNERRTRSAQPDALSPGIRWDGYLYATAGAIVGPYLGVWMSLVASDRVPIGIAQTLASLPPIFILPFVVVIYREPVSGRAAVGACAAVAGCVMLFLSPGG